MTPLYESEGYCPFGKVQLPNDMLDIAWDMIGPHIVYSQKDKYGNLLNVERCNKLLTDDASSYDIYATIVRDFCNYNKVVVHQLYNGVSTKQMLSDCIEVIIQAICEHKRVSCVYAGNSEFFVVFVKASYGVDIYFWDNTITF